MAKNTIREIGDGTQIRARNKNIDINTDLFDDLENDCWKLFKQYAAAFDVELKLKDPNDVDFYIAKTIQDTILDIFTEAGFHLKFEETN